jgi:hypothetical protein
MVVPAFRQTLGWNFGQVIDYRPETLDFYMSFDPGENEWVQLEHYPFEAYAAFYRMTRKSTRDKKVEPHNWHQDSLSWAGRNDTGSGSEFLRSLYCEKIPSAIDVDYASSLKSSKSDGSSGAADNNPDGTGSITSPLRTNMQKSTPRHWKRQEDALLLRAVAQSLIPVKWNYISRGVPNRTGKQCRERYLNHLSPNVKVENWSPVEDATLCRMYNSLGPKWSEICRKLPGRSDNSCKNRHHYYYNQLEKHVASLAKDVLNSLQQSQMRPHIMKAASDIDLRDEVLVAVAPASVHFVQNEKLLGHSEYVFVFGPFHQPEGLCLCTRCGLLVPTCQSGRFVCTKTGWCVECTKCPAFLHDDLLRLTHSVRAMTRPKRVSLCEDDATALLSHYHI